MALFVGVGQQDVGDSSGDTVDKQFTPLDIGVRCQRGGLGEHSLNGRCDDMMGYLELGEGSIRASENDQVTQGCPLCSGHPNIGVASIRLQCLIACSYQSWGLGLGLGLKVCHERRVVEGDHEAGPYGQLWFRH